MDHKEFSRKGGLAKSPAKTAAVTENAKRPRCRKKELAARRQALEDLLGIMGLGNGMALDSHSDEEDLSALAAEIIRKEDKAYGHRNNL